MDEDIHESRENQRPRLQLLLQVGDASRINQGATNQFDEQLGVFFGINRTDGRCIDTILRLGRVSAGQLANLSNLTTGAVTAVIDRLERAGYVARVRDTLDRRKIWVEPTPHARALADTIFGVYEIIGPLMTRRFSDEQLAGILAFLRMDTHVQEALTAGLEEHTRPGLAPEGQLDRARQFRRAIDALAPKLAADFDGILPGGE